MPQNYLVLETIAQKFGTCPKLVKQRGITGVVLRRKSEKKRALVALQVKTLIHVWLGRDALRLARCAS